MTCGFASSLSCWRGGATSGNRSYGTAYTEIIRRVGCQAVKLGCSDCCAASSCGHSLAGLTWMRLLLSLSGPKMLISTVTQFSNADRPWPTISASARYLVWRDVRRFVISSAAKPIYIPFTEHLAQWICSLREPIVTAMECLGFSTISAGAGPG